MRLFALTGAIVLLAAGSVSAGSVNWKVGGKEQCTSWSFSFSWSTSRHDSREDCEKETDSTPESSTEKCDELTELLECLKERLTSFKWDRWEDNCDEGRWSEEDCEETEWEQEECEEDQLSWEECEERKKEECEEFEPMWDDCNENDPPALIDGEDDSQKNKFHHSVRRHGEWKNGHDSKEDCEEDTEDPVPAATLVELAPEIESAVEVEAAPELDLSIASHAVTQVSAITAVAEQAEPVAIDEAPSSIVAPEQVQVTLAEALAAPAETVVALVEAIQEERAEVDEPLVLVTVPTKVLPKPVAPSASADDVAEPVADAVPVPVTPTTVVAAVPEPSAAVLGLLALGLFRRVRGSR